MTRAIRFEMSLVWMLNIARQRVWLTAGYFGPNEPLLTALQLAAARGVDVRMLVAGKSDHPMLVNVGRSYYEELLRYGVKIYEYEAGINHAKVALIDEEWLMVGSANLDVRSMRLELRIERAGARSGDRGRFRAGAWREILKAPNESSRRSLRGGPRLQRWKESLVRPLAPLL